jgi:hypothetical protein
MSTSHLKIAYGSLALPLKINAFELPCYILSDKQRVFSIGGIQKFMSYEGKSETWLLNILNAISKFEKIPKALLQAYENPTKIEISYSKNTVETIGVIPSDLFLATCLIVIEAKNNGLLGANLVKISKPAALFLAYTKNQNIHNLIDVATGYLNYKIQVMQFLEQYMQAQIDDAAALWLNTISEDFYSVLFEVHNQDWHTIKSNPEIIGSLLHDLIFSRIDAALLHTLRTKPPKRTYQRKDNRPQNNENTELKRYINDLMALLKTANYNWFIFLQLLNRTYPIKNHYSNTLRFKNPLPKKEPLSTFNNHLKKLT